MVPRLADPSHDDAVVAGSEAAFCKDRRAPLEFCALRASYETSTDVGLQKELADLCTFSAPGDVGQNLVELVQFLLAVRVAGGDSTVLP